MKDGHEEEKVFQNFWGVYFMCMHFENGMYFIDQTLPIYTVFRGCLLLILLADSHD